MLVVVDMVVVVLGVVGLGVVIGILFGFVVVVATRIGIRELNVAELFLPSALTSLDALGEF